MLDPALIAPEKVRPLKRVEYDRMVELGLFASQRVELLYGALVQMTPQGGHHAYLLVQLNKLFVSALGDRADVRLQMPLAATEDSEPEPDLAIVSPGQREHPKTAFLVIGRLSPRAFPDIEVEVGELLG